MLNFNVGMVIGWFVGCFILGFGGAWLANKRRAKKYSLSKESAVLVSEPSRDTHPEIMVKLLPAVNGKLLEISTKKVINHQHWEWVHEMYIVEEGQLLSDAIAKVMLLKGLAK